jgi:hypothetical protein
VLGPQIRVLEYDADRESLASVHAWAHPEEVWDIATQPTTSGTFLTVHSKGIGDARGGAVGPPAPARWPHPLRLT